MIPDVKNTITLPVGEHFKIILEYQHGYQGVVFTSCKVDFHTFNTGLTRVDGYLLAVEPMLKFIALVESKRDKDNEDYRADIETKGPEITGERYATSDFTGFRIEGLKLIDRPTVFSYNDNPYHNELHCRIVATVAVYLAKHYNIPATDIGLLELAAFLHDVGHSGGVDTDDVNINFVLDYIKDSKYVPQLTEVATETLKGLIRALSSHAIMK